MLEAARPGLTGTAAKAGAEALAEAAAEPLAIGAWNVANWKTAGTLAACAATSAGAGATAIGAGNCNSTAFGLTTPA